MILIGKKIWTPKIGHFNPILDPTAPILRQITVTDPIKIRKKLFSKMFL